MKKVLLVAMLLLVLGAANAYAVPVSFNVDELYDWGRLYSFAAGSYTTTNSNPAYFGGGSDTPVGTVRPANTFGQADGQEDSWGVGSIASITSIPVGTTYFQRTASQELTLMFQGFDDDFLASPILGTTILATGGHVSIYLDTTPDFVGALGTAGRTGQTAYTGATEGLLVLDLAPVYLSSFGHTMSSNFDFLSSTGSGAMYLQTTGLGAWDSLFDTNTQRFGSDFSFTYTVRDNTNPTVGNWVVRGDGGGEGNVVPEPASMALLGLGLLGVVRRFRRKS